MTCCVRSGWTSRVRAEAAARAVPFRLAGRGGGRRGKDATGAYTEERYTHADGTRTIIREYRADGSYHLMSDRGEIELIDNASDPYAADPVSVVRLP